MRIEHAKWYLLAVFVFVLSFDNPSVTAEDFIVKDRMKKIEFLHDAISTLNLLNGLHLTDKQIKGLLKLNHDMRNRETTYLENKNFKAVRKDTEDALEDLYNYLKKNPEKENKRVQQKAQKAHEDFKNYVLMRGEDLKKDINDVARRTERLLTPEQVKIVKDFLPCIVPPQDLRDPVKAGQAEQENQKAVEILNRIRKVKNPKIVDAAAARIADYLVSLSNAYYYKMNDQEKQKEKKRIVGILVATHKLSDTEFELKKSEIIRKLVPNAKKLTKLYELADKRNPHTSGLGSLQEKKIIKYLLNPDIMIPILESWQKAERSGGLR